MNSGSIDLSRSLFELNNESIDCHDLSFLIGVAAHLIDNVAHLIGTSGLWFGISFHFAGSVIHLIDTGIHPIEIVIVCLEPQIVF